MERRVVITGMGIWSCLGTDLETVKNSLYNGKSGIGIQPERLTYGYRSALTGIVEEPIITKKMLDRHTRAGMSEEAKYAYMSSLQAFCQAGISDEYLLNNEVGCIFGNDSSAKPVIEASKIMDEKHDSAMLGYGIIFQSMNSTVNMNLSTIFHLRGVNFTVSSACASGSHSIGLGFMMIKQGLQDMVLCGGAQETNYYSMASFDALGAFSIRMNEPTKASRPFDRDRDGLIPSGGAASLVLEEYEHAKARGANILAEVVGYGFSSNGGGISQPSDDGSVIAMTRALNMAGVKEDDIDYINAHATSTHQGDMYEAIALNRMFNGRHALISSTKGMTGHECWMAGASEVVYSTLMMQNNFVAPNINFENPDEYSGKLNIAAKTYDTEINTVLSNSFGFGGTNSALVIKKSKNIVLKKIIMRKILLFLIVIMVTLTVGAQKILEGTKPSLKGVNKISLKIDFSETKIDNKTVADWLEYRQASQPKYNAKNELENELKPVVQEKVIKSLNDKLSKKGAFVTLNSNAKYTLLVKPVSVSMKGDNTNDCYILDEFGNILVKFHISGSGGHWGTMSNLWGDGYEDSAKSIASFVVKCFK